MKCYEVANETEEELKKGIEDLKVKVAFLRIWFKPILARVKTSERSRVLE